MRRVIAVLPLLLALAVPSALAAPSVDTGLGIRLLEAPVGRQDDPRALVYIVDHVSPGSTFSRRFEVVNDSPTPVTVALYAVASEIAGGSFTPLPGRTPNELASWMSVAPSELRLAPRARQAATVTIAVPRDASAGERYAALMAETVVQQDGVAVNTRVGIRTYLDIGQGGEPASDFVIEALTASRQADGRPVVQATVRNTGGRALDMSGGLSLTAGPGGLSAGPFPAQLGTTLARGDSQAVKVVLDKALPAGPWKARIGLKSGLVERVAEGVIVFPDAPGARGPVVRAEPVPLARNANVVVPVAIALLALVTTLLLFVLWRRRRRRREGHNEQSVPLPIQRRSLDETARR